LLFILVEPALSSAVAVVLLFLTFLEQRFKGRGKGRHRQFAWPPRLPRLGVTRRSVWRSSGFSSPELDYQT
jgi:hypothetical protein